MCHVEEGGREEDVVEHGGAGGRVVGIVGVLLSGSGVDGCEAARCQEGLEYPVM